MNTLHDEFPHKEGAVVERIFAVGLLSSAEAAEAEVTPLLRIWTGQSSTSVNANT
jgi:hypothetical protein